MIIFRGAKRNPLQQTEISSINTLGLISEVDITQINETNLENNYVRFFDVDAINNSKLCLPIKTSGEESITQQ